MSPAGRRHKTVAVGAFVCPHLAGLTIDSRAFWAASASALSTRAYTNCLSWLKGAYARLRCGNAAPPTDRRLIHTPAART